MDFLSEIFSFLDKFIQHQKFSSFLDYSSVDGAYGKPFTTLISSKKFNYELIDWDSKKSTKNWQIKCCRHQQMPPKLIPDILHVILYKFTRLLPQFPANNIWILAQSQVHFQHPSCIFQNILSFELLSSALFAWIFGVSSDIGNSFFLAVAEKAFQNIHVAQHHFSIK